jgi:hypothetical protein
MAVSTCAKCGGNDFEIVTSETVRNAVFKVRFVQCAFCGVVVGVQEYDDNNFLIETLAHKLGVSLH